MRIKLIEDEVIICDTCDGNKDRYILLSDKIVNDEDDDGCFLYVCQDCLKKALELLEPDERCEDNCPGYNVCGECQT